MVKKRIAVSVGRLEVPPAWFLVDIQSHLRSHFETRIFAQKVLDTSGVPHDMRPPERGLHSPLRLARDLRSYDPALVHHHWATWSTPFVAASLFPRKPFLLNIHGYDMFLPASMNLTSQVGKLVKLIERAGSFARAECVLVHSAYMKKLVEKSYAGPISLIPHGVDTKQFAPQPVRRQEHILYVGRMSPEKGPHLLLEALRKIPTAKRPRARFLGTGPMLKSLRSFAEEHKLPAEFPGKVCRDRLPQEFSSATFVVCPSAPRGIQQEAAGIIPMEAQASGTAVLATECGGLTESLAEELTSFIAQPDTASLADSIMRMLEQDTESLGRSARSHAESKLDLHGKAAAMKNLYSRLIKGQ